MANLLCPGNTVVSGSRSACERLGQTALDAGAMKVIPLRVAGAFHTPLMQSARDRLAAALAEVELRSPKIPVVFNVSADACSDPQTIRELLVRQLTQPVLWEDSMRRLITEDCETFYEVGPGKILRGLLRRIDRKRTCHNSPSMAEPARNA